MPEITVHFKWLNGIVCKLILVKLLRRHRAASQLVQGHGSVSGGVGMHFELGQGGGAKPKASVSKAERSTQTLCGACPQGAPTNVNEERNQGNRGSAQ